MVTRTVQILTTYLSGYPSQFEIYQPGTIVSGDTPPGYRWSGRISQLQVFTDSRAINAISLSLLNEDGSEFEILEEVRFTRSNNPLDLIPLLGYEDGLLISADTALRVKIRYPQNVQPDNFITLMGFAEETGIGEIPGLTLLGVGAGGTGRSSLTAGSLLVGNGAGAIALLAPGTDGQILTSSGGAWVVSDNEGGSGPGGSVDWASITNKPTLFSGAYADLTGKPSLATVAATGSYSDLLNKPTLFSGSYADLTNVPTSFPSAWSSITGKPTFATVATSGDYLDLLNKPTLFSGAYADLTGKPSLATVAATGSYSDLLNKPTLFSGAYADLTGKPSLFSGSYADLTNVPTSFPSAWSSITGKPTFAAVATSGAYSDLTGTPTIPSVPTKSTTPPTSPTAGQEWTQVDGSGNFLKSWFWNSSISEWVGRLLPWAFLNNPTQSSFSANANIHIPRPFPASRFLIQTFDYSAVTTATTDSSNYWTVNFGRLDNASFTGIASVTLNTVGTFNISTSINQKSSDLGSFQQFRLQMTKVGTPANLPIVVVLMVRELYG